MRPLPSAPPPDSAGRPPGASLSMPPSCTNSWAWPSGQKPSTSSQKYTNGENPSYTWGRSTSPGPNPVCSHRRRAVSKPMVMMSSSGQCVCTRRVVGCPVAYPLTVTGGCGRSFALGRREDERGHAVDGDVAVVLADRVVDRRRREVLLGGQRLLVPVRPRDAGAVLARLDQHRGHRLASRRSAGGTPGTATRSSPAARSTPAVRSTAPSRPLRASGCRGSSRPGCGARGA